MRAGYGLVQGGWPASEGRRGRGELWAGSGLSRHSSQESYRGREGATGAPGGKSVWEGAPLHIRVATGRRGPVYTRRADPDGTTERAFALCAGIPSSPCSSGRSDSLRFVSVTFVIGGTRCLVRFKQKGKNQVDAILKLPLDLSWAVTLVPGSAPHLALLHPLALPGGPLGPPPLSVLLLGNSPLCQLPEARTWAVLQAAHGFLDN